MARWHRVKQAFERATLRGDLVPPFEPTRWLKNPHLQTVFGTALRRPPPVPDRRLERWSTPDGDALRVHVIDPPERGAPIALLLHGLEGSADAPYVRGMTAGLAERGFGVVAFDQRSCGGEMNRAPRLYHTGETEDLDFVVRGIVSRWPDHPVVAAGVSMGANQLLKWLGTAQVPDALQGAAAICPPFDLTVSGPHMDRRQRWYVAYFLRTLIPKALAKEQQYPGILDAARVRRALSFQTFDDAATAPLHGFRGAADYYRAAGCGRYLSGVQVPTLLLAAEDDPFNPPSTLPRRLVADHPALISRFTRRGGHVGFVSGSGRRPVFWTEEAVVRYFDWLMQSV